MPPSYHSIGQHGTTADDENMNTCEGGGFVRVVEGKNVVTLTRLGQAHSQETDNDDSESVDEVPSNKLLSPLEASIHLVKGNLGPGCLNLPHAFAIAGWGLGSGLFALVALQGIYSMWLLVQCKNLLHTHFYGQHTTSSGDHPKIHTFMEVARAALGSAGGRVVEIFLFVLQGGVCCVFLSLLSTNLVAALPFLSSTLAVLLVTILVSVMVLLRFLKDLVWLSASANFIMIAAILTASLAGLLHWMRRNDNAESYVPPPPISHRPLSAAITFTADLFFSFEGIGLVLPIENCYSPRQGALSTLSDNRQQQPLSFDRILIRSMSVTAMLFILVGLPAVFGFPDIQSGSVTAYLKERYPHQLWFSFINAMVMVAVALTFPLQLQPAVQVLNQWIDNCCSGGHVDDEEDDPELSSPIDGDIEIERVSLHEGRRASPLQRRSSSSMSRSLSEQYPSRLTFCGCGSGSSEYTWLFRRWGIVLVCALVVVLVDDLGVLMALFGAVGQTGLAAMPCAIHLALQRQGVAPKNRLRTVIDFSIVLFCGAVMLTGCTLAIHEIAEEK